MIAKNSLNGYILEFDLQYPKKLYELHNDYQSTPEKLEISHDILPKYCSNIANEYDINIGVTKLAPHLGNKDIHVLHYRNLQLCLPLGIKLGNFHRIQKFKQLDWLKKYILKTDTNKETQKKTCCQ